MKRGNNRPETATSREQLGTDKGKCRIGQYFTVRKVSGSNVLPSGPPFYFDPFTATRSLALLALLSKTYALNKGYLTRRKETSFPFTMSKEDGPKKLMDLRWHSITIYTTSARPAASSILQYRRIYFKRQKRYLFCLQPKYVRIKDFLKTNLRSSFIRKKFLRLWTIFCARCFASRGRSNNFSECAVCCCVEIVCGWFLYLCSFLFGRTPGN